MTGPTLQGLPNSDGEPIPYAGAKGRPCVEGDLSRLTFPEQTGRETKWEAKAVVPTGVDGGGLDQRDGCGDGEMSMVVGEMFRR